jgi:hypothetical protein
MNSFNSSDTNRSDKVSKVYQPDQSTAKQVISAGISIAM